MYFYLDKHYHYNSLPALFSLARTYISILHFRSEGNIIHISYSINKKQEF